MFMPSDSNDNKHHSQRHSALFLSDRQCQRDFDSCKRLNYDVGMNKLRETLDREMQKRGWNPYDVQRATGVSQSAVQRFISGERDDLRTNTVRRLAKGMGLTEAQLRGFEPIDDDQVDDASRLMRLVPTAKKKSKSQTNRYWNEMMDMCDALIDDGTYPNTEETRRSLYWEAADLMARFNYPNISLIEGLLRDKVRKTEKNS
jgi:predicted transcriptional regulator